MLNSVIFWVQSVKYFIIHCQAEGLEIKLSCKNIQPQEEESI